MLARTLSHITETGSVIGNRTVRTGRRPANRNDKNLILIYIVGFQLILAMKAFTRIPNIHQ